MGWAHPKSKHRALFLRAHFSWLALNEVLHLLVKFRALSSTLFPGKCLYCLISHPLWSCKLCGWDFSFPFFHVLLSHSSDRLIGLNLRKLWRLAHYRRWLPILHLVSRLSPSYHHPISILIRFVLWFTINGRNGLWGLQSWSLAYWNFLLWLLYKIQACLLLMAYSATNKIEGTNPFIQNALGRFTNSDCFGQCLLWINLHTQLSKTTLGSISSVGVNT